RREGRQLFADAHRREIRHPREEPRARVQGVRVWSRAALFYTALAVAYTWPLILHLSSTLPSDIGDPALNTWILWWNAHAIPLTTRWWNGPMFWPTSGTLAFSEVLVGISLIATPLQW